MVATTEQTVTQPEAARPTAHRTTGARVLRSEWIKTRSLRSTWITAASILLVIVGFGVLALASATF